MTAFLRHDNKIKLSYENFDNFFSGKSFSHGPILR